MNVSRLALFQPRAPELPCLTCPCSPLVLHSPLSGDNAEIGKINKLVSQVENIKTNLVIQMEILGRWLAIMVITIAIAAFLVSGSLGY